MTPRRPATQEEQGRMSPMLLANYAKWLSVPKSQVDRCPLGIGITTNGKIEAITNRQIICILDPREVTSA